MIYLNSGRPGSGKTLNAIQRGIAWVAEGRCVYEHGINGVDYVATGFQRYPGELSDWKRILQPGDVLIVDEVQAFIRKGIAQRDIPSWIEELTRNRHYGVDFLWTTQRPGNLDPFLRGLVNEHRHFVNVMGGASAKVYLWPDGVDDPEAPSAMERAEASKWPYPKELYGCYKSAQLHTRKRRIPKQAKVLGCAIVLAFILAIGGWTFAKRRLAPQQATAQRSGAVAESVKDGSGLSVFGSSGAATQAHVMSRKEWIERQMPRIAAMPWSAPMFDERKPTVSPDILCVALVDGSGDVAVPRCQCYTEQVTRIDVEFKQCYDIALHGVYNPFRSQLQRHPDAPQERRRDDGRQVVSSDSWAQGLAESDQQRSSAEVQRPGGSAKFGAGPTTNASGPVSWGNDPVFGDGARGSSQPRQ